MSQNRYPGVKPFERSEENIFFGRDQDIEHLYELILLEKLVTLFGKSGYGKSSLLNAGILPKFEAAAKESTEYFLPLTIRFGAYVAGKQAIAPVKRIRQRLAETLEPSEAMAFIDPLSPGPSLWQAFKQRQSPEHHRFLLIFDQFEELFTYPPEQQNAFKKQLAELLYVAIPQNIRDRAEDLSEEEYDRLVKRLEAKAVFAIRSDQLSLLDQLKDALPAILRIRYELKPLQRDQARTAIVKPAAITSTAKRTFSTEPFAYTPGAVDTVIGNLADNRQGDQVGIESFLLQMICREIEYAVRNGQMQQQNEAGLALVTEAELPDISNIYDQYYKRNLSLLPPAQQEAAKLVIEEGLLLVNEESGEVRRLSVDGGALTGRYRKQGVDEALLDALVNAFLLRRERNSTGGYNYEISHDTLIKPIAQSRQERRAEEERLKNERRRREAEALAQEEAKKRAEAERLQQEAERGRRRALLFSYLATALLLIALGAVYLAWRQSQIANSHLQEVLEAKAGEDFQKYEQLLQRAADLEALYPDAACALYVQADSLYRLHEETEIFGEQANIIQEKLQNCK
jgi:hypothetical protein